MARYVATIVFGDGDKIQAVATGDPGDHLHGVLRSEALTGVREMFDICCRTFDVDDAEAEEVAETLRKMDEE